MVDILISFIQTIIGVVIIGMMIPICIGVCISRRHLSHVKMAYEVMLSLPGKKRGAVRTYLDSGFIYKIIHPPPSIVYNKVW